MHIRLVNLVLKSLGAVLLAGLTLVSLYAASIYLRRPSRTSDRSPLFEGVGYERHVKNQPRPLMVHLARLDLFNPHLRLFVTPGETTGGREVRARTTSEFLREFGVQLAINGSFFEPFHSNTPLDYYPRSGDPVDVIGLSTSNGVTYSANDGKRSVLCIDFDNRVRIQPGKCPAGTAQALGGHVMLVEEGQPASLKASSLEPRTAVGLDHSGRFLLWIVVDGRQPGYSEGVTLSELAQLSVELGAWTVLNLDGGGSTTMVMERAFWPRLLNTPVHTRLPLRERPVANHIGVYARDLDR